MAKKNFEFGGFVNKAMAQKKQSDDVIKENISILPELKELIPPLSQEEFNQLESNILKEGCRDALVIWDNEGTPVLIDGHNRYDICQRNKIKFQIKLIDFQDIEEVKDWMINNQLGKRNVTEETKSWLRGLQYTREKNRQGGDRRSKRAKTSGQTDHLKTHERLAKQHKVSPKTIQRDEKYAQTILKITGNNKELRRKILQKEIILPKNIVLNMSQEDEKILQNIGKQLEQGIDIEQAKKKASSPSKTKKANPPKEADAVKEIKTDILKSLNILIKEKDKTVAKEIRALLKKLEKELFIS